MKVWGLPLTLQTSSGVFSHGRLDTGTAVLFRAAQPRSESGSYLDLGCGYGVIACAIAALLPSAKVWAVDVNERALRLSRDNASMLGLGGRVAVSLPDELPPELRFDEIWSNPPIRVGKGPLHELLLTWLPRLTPRGRAVLVVGRNLGADSLQQWIIGAGFECRRLGSAKGFRVLEASRPAGQP